MQVKVKCGKVAGRALHISSAGVAAVWKGIPYGSVPARWTPPVAAPCWPGSTLNATEPRGMCWQMDGKVYGPPAGPQVEQCLNLDVFTNLTAFGIGPAGRPKPVVVFLYGGSLVAGSTGSYPGIGQLAVLEDIVLVVPNYRLAAFGYLTHPALDRTDPRGVSGNYGLLDQQLALRWVAENVAAFGGDPGRVSVLGQSSGGTSILGLLASPGSRGLFHAAISLSASPNVTMDLQQAHRQNAKVVAAQTDCAGAADVAACLRGLTSQQVAALLPAASFDVSPTLPRSPAGNFILFVLALALARPHTSQTVVTLGVLGHVSHACWCV